MKKITSIIFAISLWALSPVSQAVVLDFEDLIVGTEYFVPSNFVTSGVTVTVSDFTFSGGGTTSAGVAVVRNTGFAGGSGNDLQVANVLLDFNFGGAIPGLNLDFGEYGGNLNIDINGNFLNFENFVDINGASIGGVAVSVVNGLGNDTGMLSLSGTINSFRLGGQELYIDNVSAVPLPAAVWLFGSAILGFVGYSRRRSVAS